MLAGAAVVAVEIVAAAELAAVAVTAVLQALPLAKGAAFAGAAVVVDGAVAAGEIAAVFVAAEPALAFVPLRGRYRRYVSIIL